MRASVVARVDAALVLELTEHVFDTVPLPVKDPITIPRGWPSTDARHNTLAIKAARSHSAYWPRSPSMPLAWAGPRASAPTVVVAGLPLGEQHVQRPARAAADGVQHEVRTPLMRPIHRKRAPF